MPRLPQLLSALLATLALTGCGGGGGGSASAIPAPLDFVHITTAANSSGWVSRLEHPLLDGNPDMIVIATSVANAFGGFPRRYPGGPLRTEYDSATGQWTLVDTSRSSGEDYAYNISIFPPGANAFRHASVAGNTTDNSTRLDHPLLNGRPDARLLVTLHREPGSATIGTDSARHIGVWYSQSLGRWNVFEQSRGSMRSGVGFSVVVLPAGIPSYDVEADGTNSVPTRPGQIQLSAPWLTHTTGEVVHQTPLWGYPGTFLAGVYLDSLPVLVRASTGWAIDANLSGGAAMPARARFTIARLAR